MDRMRKREEISATRRLSGMNLAASLHIRFEAVALALRAMAIELDTEPIHSVNSIDEMLSADNLDLPTDAWRTELADRIQENLDRKRSSVQGRETCLTAYVRILTAHYAEEEIRGKEAELVTAFLKSIKIESSEKETVLAMKGGPNPAHEPDLPVSLTLCDSTCHDTHHVPLRPDLRSRLRSSQENCF